MKLQNILFSLAAASVAALCFSLTALVWIYGPRLLTHADGALTRLEGIESKANATLVNIDRASKTWADASKQEAGDIADTMTQVRGTLSGAQDAFASIPPVAQRLQGTADAATGLLASAQATTDTLPPLVGHIDTAVQGIGPVEQSSTQAIAHFDELLKSQSVTSNNVQAITGNLAATTGDFQKRFHEVLYPAPCRTFGCKLGRAWPLIRDVPALGESAYWTTQLIHQTKP